MTNNHLNTEKYHNNVSSAKEGIPEIALIVMLSGSGKRFGGNKLLTEFLGEPLYHIALRQAAHSGADRVTVVTAYEEIISFCKNHYPQMCCIRNEHPERGISESIKLGLCQEACGCCFLVGDQPYLKASTIQKMFAAFRENPDMIHVCSDGTRRGNPVVFPSIYFPELMALEGDQGGKGIIRKHSGRVREVKVDDGKELLDIDTKEDAEKLGRRFLFPWYKRI